MPNRDPPDKMPPASYQLEVSCDDDFSIKVIVSPATKAKQIIKDICASRRINGKSDVDIANLMLAIEPTTSSNLVCINEDTEIGTVLEDKLYKTKNILKPVFVIGCKNKSDSAAVDFSRHVQLMNSSIKQLHEYSSSLQVYSSGLAQLVNHKETVSAYDSKSLSLDDPLNKEFVETVQLVRTRTADYLADMKTVISKGLASVQARTGLPNSTFETSSILSTAEGMYCTPFH